MKLAILTTDIIDGIVISQNIIRSGKDVRAIVYERKKQTLKSSLKRALFRLKGLISRTSYPAMTAEKKDLLVRAVENINSEETRSILEDISPDLIVVIGTRKLDKAIFGGAKLGAINMHSGILPYYRGADSEFWALYNGEKDRIGVSVHFIDERLDAGDIILRARQDVSPEDNYKVLRMKNIMLGAEKMVEAVDLIESGSYERIEQDEREARTYKSVTKEDLKRYREKISKC